MNSDIVQPDEFDTTEKLSVGEKIGYGLGDTASNFYWKLFENFQLFFYTDVFGITASAAATMFFVTKLWDAINDPLIGLMSDRTKTAWGRFRPYLLWGCVPFAATGILTFYTPNLGPTGKLIYAYVTYTLVFMAYTLINIPYGALMGVISSSSLERTSVSTYRFVLAFCGGLIVQKFTEPLVAFFGGTETQLVDGVEKIVVLDKQAGFFWTVVCYATAAVILFLITFASTKERVVPEQKKNTAFRQDIWDLMRNRAWLVLLAVGLFQILAGWTRGSAIAYYFTYYVVDPATGAVGIPFGTFLAVGTIFSILGMLMTRPLTAIFGKKLLMILMNLAVAALTASFLFVKPDQIALMYGLNILLAFVGGPVPVLLWAMYADAADYSEWRFHRRATGLVFSAATFSQKLGGALGAAIPGWMLAWYGFVAPVEGSQQVQSAHTIDGIIRMMSVVPAIFLVAAAFALLFYNISAKFLHQIEHDLRERKATKAGDGENPSEAT